MQNIKQNKTKKPDCKNNLVFYKCPEQDSNLHTVTGTSPSSWRVYQFHHLGGRKDQRRNGTMAQRLFTCLKTTSFKEHIL
jgi:hypothetical protein